MAYTADIEDSRPKGEPKAVINAKAATTFIDSNQNTDPTVALADLGGFHYRPDESPSGSLTNKAGVVYFRSYGSITYAGTLSLLYSDVDKKDPRVRSALDWASRHWTLDENPGMGQEGKYFFYNVMSKCMNATGQDFVQLKNSKSLLNWREAVLKKLISSQKIHKGTGYWVNEEGRWAENDPVLTTAYSVLTLEQAYIDEQ